MRGQPERRQPPQLQTRWGEMKAPQKKRGENVTKATRRSAESRDGPESRSNPPGATSAGKDNAPGSTQCKITDFTYSPVIYKTFWIQNVWFIHGPTTNGQTLFP